MNAINVEFPPKMAGLFQSRLPNGEHPRYKVFYGGRGGAKSWSGARAALLVGMGGGPAGVLLRGDGRTHDGLRTLCVREVQDSLRDSVKRTLADQIVLMGLADYYEVLDEVIRGRRGTSAQGTEFFFEGLRRNINKIKSYEGIDLVLAEEAEPVSENSWNTLIPTIRTKPPHGPLKAGAEFWIFYNPVLESGATHQRFVIHPPSNALVEKVTWRDNPWFPLEQLRPDMERDRARSIDLYNHIWEGECFFNLDGAVLAEELREAQEAGRICELDVSRMSPVSVYFDLGHSDYTVMWFVQRNGWDFRVIDFYQNNRQHIDHYLGVLQSRGYVYDTLWLPHDARAKTVGTKMSVEEQVREKGYRERVRIVPKLSVVDGIQAIRTVFPNCYFDRARCAEGLKGLREWVYDIDPITRELSKNPVHSDIGDAFKYFAIASKMKASGRVSLDLPGLREGEERGSAAPFGSRVKAAIRGLGVPSPTGWLGR